MTDHDLTDERAAVEKAIQEAVWDALMQIDGWLAAWQAFAGGVMRHPVVTVKLNALIEAAHQQGYRERDREGCPVKEVCERDIQQGYEQGKRETLLDALCESPGTKCSCEAKDHPAKAG